MAEHRSEVFCATAAQRSLPRRLDELLGVIPLVLTQHDCGLRIWRDLPGIVNHDFRRFACGVVVCPGYHGTGNQPVAVITQHVWPMKRNSLPVLPLRYSLASASVLDSCVSFERVCPLQLLP